MKKIISVIMIFALISGLAACAGSTGSDNIETKSSVETEGSHKDEGATEAENASDMSEATSEGSSVEQAADNNQTTKDVLVVYFSATGTTKGVAEKIAAAADADIYEIKAVNEYTEDDLNWHDSDSRTTKEQNDEAARPEIGSAEITPEKYSTIYIGYTIWWGEEPRIMDTFVESYNFDGINMVPFCTSGGSGIGRSGQNLADNAGSGNWLDGKRFSAGVSEEDIREWISELFNY